MVRMGKRNVIYCCHLCIKEYQSPNDLRRHLDNIHDIPFEESNRMGVIR